MCMCVYVYICAYNVYICICAHVLLILLSHTKLLMDTVLRNVVMIIIEEIFNYCAINIFCNSFNYSVINCVTIDILDGK